MAIKLSTPHEVVEVCSVTGHDCVRRCHSTRGRIYRNSATLSHSTFVNGLGELDVCVRRLVQLPSPCDGKELVVDFHAVVLVLVARVHVEASPEAMIPAAVFHVVAGLGRSDWQCSMAQ